MNQVVVEGKADTMLPGLVAENSFDYGSILKKLNNPISENTSPRGSPNTSHIIEIDEKERKNPNLLGDRSSPTDGDETKEMFRLRLNDQSYHSQKSLPEISVNTPKMMLSRMRKITEDRIGESSRVIYSGRSIDRNFNEALDPDNVPKRRNSEHESLKDPAEEKQAGNESSFLDYSESYSLNLRNEPRTNQSQVIAVQDYKYFLQEADSPQPKRKSRFSNMALAGNTNVERGNEKRDDESTDVYDNDKESGKGNSISVSDKNQEVKNLENPDDINGELEGYKLRTNPIQINPGKFNLESEDFIKDALGTIRTLELFCECAIVGSEKHLKCMQTIIEEDPKRNILERNDREHLLNKKNRFQQNALYLACKNGNLNVVKFLIQESANPHIESSPDGKGKAWEKPLNVAARWGHLQVVNFLLEKVSYSQADLKRAFKAAEKPLIRQAIEKSHYEKYKKRSRMSNLRASSTKITRFQDLLVGGLSTTARSGSENDSLVTQRFNMSTIAANEVMSSVRARSVLRSQSARKNLHDSGAASVDTQPTETPQRNEQASVTESNAKNVSTSLANNSETTKRSDTNTSRPSSESVVRKLFKKQLKVDVNLKSELMAVVANKTVDYKPTYLSHESERKMLHQLYIKKPDDKTPVKFTMHHDSNKPDFQNMTNEELDMQQSMYEKFKKNFNRMVFDKDRNYLFLRVPKISTDRALSPDAHKRQKTNNLFRKIEARVKGLDAEAVLKTAKDEKPSYMKSARDINEKCRQQKLDLLGTKLRGLRHDIVVEKAKSEIADISKVAGLAIDKLEDQNMRVKDENVGLVTKNEDLQTENHVLKRKTQLLQQEVLQLTTDNEALHHRIQSLEYFAPIYFALQAKFKDISVTNIIAKIERLEDYCQEYLKKISQLEEELRNCKGGNRQVQAILKEKDTELQSELHERTKLINFFKGEISGLEKTIRDRDDYQQDYIKLSNRVMALYTKWTDQCQVYTKIEELQSLAANPKDPFELIDILERVLRVATPTLMQKYMRQVIVSANQLRRKFLPKNVNLKFDPDKIYEAVTKYINSLESEIKRLKPFGPPDTKKKVV